MAQQHPFGADVPSTEVNRMMSSSVLASLVAHRTHARSSWLEKETTGRVESCANVTPAPRSYGVSIPSALARSRGDLSLPGGYVDPHSSSSRMQRNQQDDASDADTDASNAMDIADYLEFAPMAEPMEIAPGESTSQAFRIKALGHCLAGRDQGEDPNLSAFLSAPPRVVPLQQHGATHVQQKLWEEDNVSSLVKHPQTMLDLYFESARALGDAAFDGDDASDIDDPWFDEIVNAAPLEKGWLDSLHHALEDDDASVASTPRAVVDDDDDLILSAAGLNCGGDHVTESEAVLDARHREAAPVLSGLDGWGVEVLDVPVHHAADPKLRRGEDGFAVLDKVDGLPIFNSPTPLDGFASWGLELDDEDEPECSPPPPPPESDDDDDDDAPPPPPHPDSEDEESPPPPPPESESRASSTSTARSVGSPSVRHRDFVLQSSRR